MIKRLGAGQMMTNTMYCSLVPPCEGLEGGSAAAGTCTGGVKLGVVEWKVLIKEKISNMNVETKGREGEETG